MGGSWFIHTVSSTAIVFAPGGVDWTCSFLTSTKSPIVSLNIDTLATFPYWTSEKCCSYLSTPPSWWYKHASKQSYVTTLLTELQWLPVAACIKFNLLMLTSRVLAGSASSYFNSFASVPVTLCSLCSTRASPGKTVCAGMAMQTIVIRDGGASWPLSEQGQPLGNLQKALENTSQLRAPALQRQFYVSPPILTNLLSPRLIVIVLHRLEL